MEEKENTNIEEVNYQELYENLNKEHEELKTKFEELTTKYDADSKVSAKLLDENVALKSENSKFKQLLSQTNDEQEDSAVDFTEVFKLINNIY